MPRKPSQEATYRAERRRLKAAQRVLIDGRLVHPDAPHGTASSYANFMCRCEPCTDAQAAQIKSWRYGTGVDTTRGHM